MFNFILNICLNRWSMASIAVQFFVQTVPRLGHPFRYTLEYSHSFLKLAILSLTQQDTTGPTYDTLLGGNQIIINVSTRDCVLFNFPFSILSLFSLSATLLNGETFVPPNIYALSF
jgi:hypothetical protein